ncbi:MAG: S8 family peptidase [Pseudomonadota bacterium]
MPSNRERNLPNFYVINAGDTRTYRAPRPRGAPLSYPNSWQAHASTVHQKIQTAITQGIQKLNEAGVASDQLTRGFYLDLDLTGVKGYIEQLENPNQGVLIRNVKQKQPGEYTVTVFVPEQSTNYYIKKAEQYQNRDLRGHNTAHKILSKVNDVAVSTFNSFLSDEDLRKVTDPTQIRWWELWLDIDIADSFINALREQGFVVSQETLDFVDIKVFLVQGAPTTLGEEILKSGGAVCEIHLSREQPHFYTKLLANADQLQAIENLQTRVERLQPFKTIIQIIDTGVNYSHPLLKNNIAEGHMAAVNSDWGTTDTYQSGHGTQMAGLALFGDLYGPLTSSEQFEISHAVGSIKILPPSGANENHLYGHLTRRAISLGEINAPELKQVYCMAVTDDPIAIGEPTAWSGAIDNICYGDVDTDGRVFLVSAGNNAAVDGNHTPQHSDSRVIEDPAHAWNAITVGAYTDKTAIGEEGYETWTPLVEAGEVSPHSTTSVGWNTEWPIKPDIVMEGGNFAKSPNGNEVMDLDDLCVVTTSSQIPNRYLSPFCGTSSATALAANLAAKIWSEKAQYWPQTIRGLLIHSAEWTSAMVRSFNGLYRAEDKIKIVRRYGMGVPSTERALFSLKDDLTIIYEDEIQPYTAEGENPDTAKMGQFKLFRLPWPKEVLQQLENEQVELKVTLSYFIEPKPGKGKLDKKHVYQSFGLRFDLKKSTETDDQFIRRFEENEDDDGESVVDETEASRPNNADGKWLLGDRGRTKGSVHSDIWLGEAIKLASKDLLCVKPVGGWWKHYKKEPRWDNPVRFALIVTIRTRKTDLNIDLYTPIETALRVPITV